VGGRSALCLEGFIMADRTIEHHWQQDPNIPQVVTGVSGGDGTAAGGGVLLTQDSDIKALLFEQTLLLREIVLHLKAMTDEEFTECDLKE